MANVIINDTNLTNIADAIREKNGTTETYKPNQMAAAILAITTGGGDSGIPEEAFHLTGTFQQRFYNSAWDWFIELYGDRVTTSLVSGLYFCFYASKVKSIPFEINLVGSANMSEAFHFCSNLEQVPHINLSQFTPVSWENPNFANMFTECLSVRSLENVFNAEELNFLAEIKVTNAYSAPNYNQVFSTCHSLRKVPSWASKLRISETSTAYPAYTPYNNTFNCCFALDEILNYPVIRCDASQSSNMFNSFVKNCFRLKNLTFETQEDGTPFSVRWSNQAIDLSTVGYGYDYVAHDKNSGLLPEHEVKSGSTNNEEIMRDHPDDWWTKDIAYSRYNRESAIATINSLPIIESGYTGDIIKFNQQGGRLNGGATGTLSEEEIAVAAAKGWTVAFVS